MTLALWVVAGLLLGVMAGLVAVGVLMWDTGELGRVSEAYRRRRQWWTR